MSVALSLGFGAAGWVGHNVSEKAEIFEGDVFEPSIGKRVVRILTNIFAGVSAGEMMVIALSTTRFALRSFALVEGVYALAIAVPVVAALNKRYKVEMNLTKLLNIVALVASVGAVAFGALSLVGWGGAAVVMNSLILLHDLYDKKI